MVCLGTCHICERTTHNAHVHTECRVAELEDVLFKIQKALEASGEIPQEIREKILSGRFRPLDEFLKEVEEEKQSKMNEHLRQVRRNLVVTRAAEEFDKNNPPKWSPPL
jgi:hypothetical protein